MHELFFLKSINFSVIMDVSGIPVPQVTTQDLLQI